jgi:hypothetical protein
MSRILITEDNGVTVSVIVPAASFTAEQCIKDVPVGAKYKIVDTSEVPSDRTFRNAWEVETDDTWETK